MHSFSYLCPLDWDGIFGNIRDLHCGNGFSMANLLHDLKLNLLLQVYVLFWVFASPCVSSSLGCFFVILRASKLLIFDWEVSASTSCTSPFHTVNPQLFCRLGDLVFSSLSFPFQISIVVVSKKKKKKLLLLHLISRCYCP